MKIIAVAVCAALASAPAFASCRDAKQQYADAVNDLAYQLQRYANCVAASDGDDDCSSEFNALKWAQDEFEDAVSNIQTYCG